MAILPDHLRTVAGLFPDRVALRVAAGASSFTEMTYVEWDGRSDAVARGLHEAGVERGDRVGLFVGNDSAALYQVAYFAVLKAGAVEQGDRAVRILDEARLLKRCGRDRR